MFSYYGSKSKIVKMYPPPKFDKIIEPFAGSARYALRFFDRDILLVDKNPQIVRLWNFLQQCQPSDILRLPEPIYKQSIDEFNISTDEKLLLGFMVAQGIASPQKIVQQFSNIQSEKKRIAKSLFKIRHWKIELGSYEDIPNQEATWFIDPPYQFGGEYYKESNKKIDFEKLADWCKTRDGQSIVCENTKASWLPFKAMVKMHGSKHTTTEAIWSNIQHGFELQQKEMFT